MTLLSLPTLTAPEIYVIGDVIIHEKAVVASGAILQAAPGYQIVIEEGACVGMGSVITASQGTITLGKGAILGAGVLMAGSGSIGNHACVGTASTLWNTSVEAMAVVAPGSLLGDVSRQVTAETLQIEDNLPPVAEILSTIPVEDDPWQEPSPIVPPREKTPVVGQVYINRLLYTLFPGRQSPPNGSG